MIKLILKKLLNTLNKNTFSNKNSYFFSKEGIHALKNTIQSHNELRKKTIYTVTNEKYILNSYSTIKLKLNGKIYLTLLHCFNITINNHLYSSQEHINLILILEKKNLLWKVTNIIRQEEAPMLYEKVKSSNNFFPSIFINNSNRSTSLNNLNTNNIVSTGFRNKIYNCDQAIYYAQKHALVYNEEYKDFDNNGGDCTNFISQCIHAGGIELSNTWNPYTNSWVRVNELYSYLINNNIAKECTNNNEYKIGTIVQFYSSEKGFFSHSGIITKSLGYGEYLYCCHSYNKLNFPLSEVYPYFYHKIRVLEIIK